MEMNLQTLLLLLVATQVPLLAFALVVQKGNRELQTNLMRWGANNLGLPLLPTRGDHVAPVADPLRVPKMVRHLQVPIPTGAVPRPPEGTK